MVTYKSYKTLASAKSAIRKQGLHLVPHYISSEPVGKEVRHFPVFHPSMIEDVAEIRGRGFYAFQKKEEAR